MNHLRLVNDQEEEPIPGVWYNLESAHHRISHDLLWRIGQQGAAADLYDLTSALLDAGYLDEVDHLEVESARVRKLPDDILDYWLEVEVLFRPER